VRPLVIAHRGASGHRPENTTPAFALAIEQRADMIETDLHATKDGVLVLTHDAELERLGGAGEVAGISSSEIRVLDAGGGEPVPFLDATLDAFGARIRWNLEIKKPGRGFYEGIEAKALAAVEARGLLAETLFSCFWDPVLARLRERSGEARLALLLDPRYPEEPVARARALGAEAINPHWSMIDGELLAAAHGEGLAVYAYTVDDAEEIRRLVDLGVDGLFTNHPDRMRALVG
jgi:glycerophosphoryl diester phosphodiesterase